MTNDEVIKMAGAGLGDAVILDKIKASQCNFNTSTDAIIKLKQAGVSDTVLEAMIAAGGGAQPATEPAPEPAPPPKVSCTEEGRWSGMIVGSDKDASTLTVRKKRTNVEKLSTTTARRSGPTRRGKKSKRSI